MLGALVILVRLTICWQAMPLFARRAADHYPDRETSPDAEQVIVLCGGLEVGGWHRVTNGPSERTWQWGVSITASSAGFLAGGSAVDEVACKVNVAVAGKRGRHELLPGFKTGSPMFARDGGLSPRSPFYFVINLGFAG